MHITGTVFLQAINPHPWARGHALQVTNTYIIIIILYISIQYIQHKNKLYSCERKEWQVYNRSSMLDVAIILASFIFEFSAFFGKKHGLYYIVQGIFPYFKNGYNLKSFSQNHLKFLHSNKGINMY